MRYMRWVLVLFLGLAIGCVSIEGRKIDGAKVKTLMNDEANQEYVIKTFGEPQEKEKLSSGEEKYVYFYRMKSRMFLMKRDGDPRDQQRLEVILKNNTVNRYRYAESVIEPITTDIPPVLPEKK
jgi:hypothetical protein